MEKRFAIECGDGKGGFSEYACGQTETRFETAAEAQKAIDALLLKEEFQHGLLRIVELK